jgi:hypothetical protein
VVVVASLSAWADSPLTSIDFSVGYAELPAVRAAKKQQLEEVYSFLASAKDNGEKLAVMSALGWQGDFATGYLEFIARAQGGSARSLTAQSLTPSQLFVAAYLIATADYLELKPLDPKGTGLWKARPIDMMKDAAAKLPGDFSVQYARALVVAQATMSNEKRWCEVFSGPDDVVKRFPPEQRNVRPASLEAARGYLAGYEESCPQSQAAKQVEREQLNQIYSLAQVGRQIVAGTQGGVVVWDPERPTPVAIKDGFICRGFTWKDAAWLGCETEVLRWDGAAFTSFLSTKDKGKSVYYEPTRGPDGSLWVRRGSKAWRYDEGTRRFTRVTPPWSADVFDATFAQGRWWWIDFLTAIRTEQKSFPKASPPYPGTDPRSFSEDARGTLWVSDFELGFFRFEPGAQRFVQVPPVTTKASGVAVDVERKRTWFLHYTEGLTVVREGAEGAAAEKIPLVEAEFMRDLLLSPNGDVWVAGWHQLLRIRADGPTWAKQQLVVKNRH